MSVEVVLAVWPFIGGLYFQAVLEFWETGKLHPAFKEGLLFLIPKVDTPETLGEWRPITLLNSIYKVVAKIFAARLALILPDLVPVNQQGFIKGRSTQNCILTYALLHEALKRNSKFGLFLSLDQEKAYDRVRWDFLWQVLQRLGFSAMCISRLKALQAGAETRILLNGNLLPAFQVERGVRQGCPLSPLLYAIFTVPLILAVQKENDSGRIKPIKLSEEVATSVVCLADDTALYTKIHRESVLGIFKLLDEFQLATGGKINWQKSKLLPIGRNRRLPGWVRDLPLQRVECNRPMRYLGASLSTLWKGVDNGNLLVGALERKSKNLSHKFMSFESRVVALKFGVFASIVYHLMNSKFKLNTIKRVEAELRKFLWSVNQQGLPKKSLVRWDSVVLPERYGGLGVFSLQDFQTALICRTVMRAISNPSQAIWPKIFASAFLECRVEALGEVMFFRIDLISANSPGADGVLLARKHLDVPTAEMITAEVLKHCQEEGVTTLGQLQVVSAGFWERFSEDGRVLAESIRLDLQSVTVGDGLTVFSYHDWMLPEGTPLGPTFRGATIYRALLSDRVTLQVGRLNDKWDLNWSLQQWRVVWRACEFRGLNHRHRYFFWRVLTKAFYVGKRQRQMGFSAFSCDYCHAEVEDVGHALWLCPRWAEFWGETQERMPGWGQLQRSREERISLPEVIFSFVSGPSDRRLFNLWLLALVWRTFWAERCTFKYQTKLNSVPLQRNVFLFLEDLRATRDRMRPEVVSRFASQLCSLVPVVPYRYNSLINLNR
ncbi:hypothetical protein R1sor_026898 [Riccia sorocarpa]|uniref:Reverse transcriptase domain-containing protein n=1 Tax=Riccia sorocarpa TaxID=122646 RepID=A0ABD3GCR1_9MARC